ncbi:MAG: hypothetical protein SFU98_01720 [Leptospiraceae bacterium]|nr:hypothetical protein [Leptospiraceae bacterium]
MKNYFKSLGLAALIILGVVNCPPDNKKDNTALLAGLFLLSQQQTYEATVSLVAKVKNADGSALSDSANSIALVKLADKSTSTSVLTIENNKNPEDFTTRAYSSGAASADNGNISITFKTKAATGNILATATQCESCVVRSATDSDYDLPSKYTKAFGTFDIALNLASTGGTDTKQITFANASGLQIEIISVTVSIKGQYNLQSPTVGENVCDGKSITGTPETLSGTLSTRTISNSAQLSGTVIVPSGVTLTVNAGAVVFGNRGSSLFVLPGGKLVANGTKAQPVCFTSSQTPGSRFPGDWGGIVLIGNGKGTRSSTTEGTSPQNYGSGTDDTDSSGTLTYSIIEFAGNEVAPGDELNGLSLYTVGSGTKIEYVQVHRGLDDSFEAWGGAVNLKYVVATGGLDDDYDLDEGYIGSITYAVSHKYPTTCGGSASTDPHSFEMDGTSGSSSTGCTIGTAARCSTPTVSYFTLVGNNSTSGEGARLREGLSGTFRNGIMYNFGAANLISGSTTGGFPGTSWSVDSTVYIQSGKVCGSVTGGSGFTGTASTSTCTPTINLTAVPITSEGDTSGCGFGATKPDYTTNTNSGAPSSVGASGTGAPSKWWDSWTVYRAR